MERLFYKQLLDWKSNGMIKPLLVLGARQVGKTYLIEAFCQAEYKRYIKINLLEEPLLAQVYQSELSSERKFEQLQLLTESALDDPQTIVFIDEVQESEEFIADLKYLQEKHPDTHIICAGSLLGVKLKRFKKSFPVGKVIIKNMFPLNFPEFLIATGKQAYLSIIQQCYQENTKMLPASHEELLQALKIYLCLGGMPEAVQQYLDVDRELLKFDRTFFDDLKTACLDDMNKYVRNLNEAVKIERIYNSVALQQSNKAHKFQYSKVRSGARSSQYETALDWLLSAELVYQARCITNPKKPIQYYVDPNVFKLFLNDVGVLTHLLGIDYKDIILDRLGQFKGILAESYVASELSAAGIPLYYWRSENNAEVDFVLEGSEGTIPLEVKSAENVQSKSLRVFCDKHHPAYAIRISAKNFGLTDGIRSVPLYAAFCLRSFS